MLVPEAFRPGGARRLKGKPEARPADVSAATVLDVPRLLEIKELTAIVANHDHSVTVRVGISLRAPTFRRKGLRNNPAPRLLGWAVQGYRTAAPAESR